MPPKPPLLPTLIRRLPESHTAGELRSQWQNPSDVLSVLLIIGGDIVQKALAQLSGGTFVPVSLSFGWVAYAFTTIISVVGDGRLMPEPDYPCKVINTATGYARENRSFMLGRLLRDQEEPLTDEALSVKVFKAVDEKNSVKLVAGKPDWGKLQMVGLVTIVVQLGVAAIPFGLYGDWGVFMITVVGTILALLTGVLPQWSAEKFACRPKSKKNIAITKGNGARHVIVILGMGVGLDLEDLAGGESPRMGRPWQNYGWFVKEIPVPAVQKPDGTMETKPPVKRASLWRGLPVDFWLTRAVCLVLAICWFALLISVAALRDNSWFLLAVGSIGMCQNAIVAGMRVFPERQGVHLEWDKTITGNKVMHALMDLEVAYEALYPKMGKSLVDEFFPGTDALRESEEKWWKGDRGPYNNKRFGTPSKEGIVQSK
jgi:hypothetical protein